MEEFVKLPSELPSQSLFVIAIWFQSQRWQKVLLHISTT